MRYTLNYLGKDNSVRELSAHGNLTDAARALRALREDFNALGWITDTYDFETFNEAYVEQLLGAELEDTVDFYPCPECGQESTDPNGHDTCHAFRAHINAGGTLD